jgi:trigger factor
LNVKGYEKKEKSMVSMTVDATAEEFDTEVEEIFRKNRGGISVPGFRKGKAPRKIIERMYGADVFRDDAIESISAKAYSFGLKETGLSAVDYPALSGSDIADDKTVSLTFEFPVYPEVKLGQYKGLSAVKPDTDVPESAVDSELAGVRLRNARIETASRPAIGGDTAYIDYEGFIDGVPFEGGKGENYELVLGSGAFIPGFEQQVQGMRAGEERDIELTFPADYKAEELAGKAAVFKVKLRDLKEKILPELDDEFAKDVSEFDTLEEYKESIRGGLRKTRESEADAEFETGLLNKIIDEMECDVPDALNEQYVDMAVENYGHQLAQYGMELSMYLNMANTTMEQLRESMRPNAQRQVLYSLALEAIADAEKIEVTDDEIEAGYAERAEQYSIGVDELKSEVSAESIKRELTTKKALGLITGNAEALPPPPPDEPAQEPVQEPAPVAEDSAKPKPARRKRAPKTAKPEAAADAEPDTTETADTTDTVKE